jgi:hypothetical protein
MRSDAAEQMDGWNALIEVKLVEDPGLIRGLRQCAHDLAA